MLTRTEKRKQARQQAKTEAKREVKENAFKRNALSQVIDIYYQEKLKHLHFAMRKPYINGSDRLNDIINALTILVDYHSDPYHKIFNNSNVVSQELQESYHLLQACGMCRSVCNLIGGLSLELRNKYKHLLPPEPFYWETLEAFGNLITFVSALSDENQQEFYKREELQGNVNIAFYPLLEEVGAINRLGKEINDEVPILEEAMNDIIRQDLNELLTLFNYICQVESGAITPEPSQLKLKHIHFITKRILDNRHLRDLINLTFSETTLNSKMEKHAFLRKLQKAGERLTGKFFSKELKQCDPQTAWGCLIAIRDGLSHLEETEKARIYQNLMTHGEHQLYKAKGHFAPPGEQPLPLLEKIWQEFQAFGFRVQRLVKRREEQGHPIYQGDAKAFWVALVAHADTKQDQIGDIPKPPATPLVPKEDIKLLYTTLKAATPPEEKSRWLSILRGVEPFPLKKSVKDNLFCHIGSKEAKKVAKQAEKESDRRQKEISKLKQEAQEARKTSNQWVGLESLRCLADQFDAASGGPELNIFEKTDIALKAINDIKTFVETVCEFGINDPWPYLLIKEGINKSLGKLLKQVMSNPLFVEAVEFNLSLLLPMLESVIRLSKQPNMNYLCQDMPYLGSPNTWLKQLRNWIAHSKMLLDVADNPKAKMLPRMHEDIVRILPSLVVHIQSELEQVRTNMQNRIRVQFFSNPQPNSSNSDAEIKVNLSTGLTI